MAGISIISRSRPKRNVRAHLLIIVVGFMLAFHFDAVANDSSSDLSDVLEAAPTHEEGVRDEEGALDDGVVQPPEEEITPDIDTPETGMDVLPESSAAEDSTEAHLSAPTEGPVVVLDLIQAQRRALAQNPSLAAGAERVEQARQLVAKARSLYFPQIDLSYTYTYTWLPSGYTDSINELLDDSEDVIRRVRRQFYEITANYPVIPLNDQRAIRSYLRTADDSIATWRDYISSPQENTTANLTAGWLLFDGFAREFANAMARHGYGEAKAAYRDGQRILLDAIAQTYYGAQFAREQMGIARASIVFFERLYTEALARREIGRGSTSDVLNFETALYAAKGNLLKATREYEMTRIAMAVLMGQEEGYLSDAVELADLETETPETMTLPEFEAMVALAYAYRPDMEQRELGLKRSQAGVRREYAKFAPQIAAIASAATANINNTGITTDRITTTVGINASMNLFSGGRRRAELIEAKHARRESEWRLVELEQKISGEVRQALMDLKIAQEGLTLQRNAATCVENNRDLVQKEYNAGKAMLVRLNQAQNDYMQAMGMLAQARVNLQRSWQALHHATGVSLSLLSGDQAEIAEVMQLSAEMQNTTDKEMEHE